MLGRRKEDTVERMTRRRIIPGRRKEGTVERMRRKENHARQKEGGHSGEDGREVQ